MSNHIITTTAAATAANNNNNNNNVITSNNNNNGELMCGSAYDTIPQQQHQPNFFDPTELYQMKSSHPTTEVKIKITGLSSADANLSKSPPTLLDLESGTIHSRQCDTCELPFSGGESLANSANMTVYKYESSDDSASLVSSSSVFDDGYYSIPISGEYQLDNYPVSSGGDGMFEVVFNGDKEPNVVTYNSSVPYFANGGNYELCHDSYSYPPVTYLPEYISFEAAPY